jgi:hypothetical protein
VTSAQAVQLKEKFLEAFRRHGNVSWACRETKVGRRTVYDWREKDEQFAAAYGVAEIEATETMEQEAYRRAVNGTAEPVFHQGKKIATVQKYSDTLLIFMLKSRAPEKYRENVHVDHAGRVEHVQLVAAQQVLRVIGGTEKRAG